MQDRRNNLYIYKVTLVAAVGGLLFGYDTAVVAGAIGFMEKYYNLTPALKGWVNSCALVGCIFSVTVAGILSDKIGRKKVLMISGLLFAISSIGTAIPPNLTVFVIFRLIGGMGIGIASMLSPMYISEMAPADIRGKLVSVFQLCVVFGIFVVYFVNAGIAGISDEAWNISTGWRWMFGSGLIPSIIFMMLLMVVPESPRWLAKQHHPMQALAVLTRINGVSKAKQELEEINRSLAAEANISLNDLFKPGLNRAIFIGILLSFFSQVTGINAIMYYAPEIFKLTGDPSDSALVQTVIVGIVHVLFTLIAIRYVDKIGRKILLLRGIAGMMISLIIIGGAFYFGMEKGYLVLIAIMTYIAFFAMSIGPLTFVVVAEIFPTRARGLAMSVAIFALWLSDFIVSQTFPILLDSIGSAYTFWVFATMAIFALLFVWRMVPETKEKTLEEIEQFWQPQESGMQPKMKNV